MELVALFRVLERAVEVVEDGQDVLQHRRQWRSVKKSAFSRSVRLRKFSKSASVRR